MNEILELSIKQAIERIKKAYESTDGQIYLSFSGGKDSTVLAKLIMMAELPVSIPFVFANTGIELTAIKDFVTNFEYDNVVIVKPRMPFGKILKEYGKPTISKLKSEMLSTYQRHIDEPFSTARTYQLITGLRVKDGEIVEGSTTRLKLADKHMHYLHADTEFKIANKCCAYLKKHPFEDFAKDNDMNGYFSGVRVAEGGVRALKYNSCTSIRKIGSKEYLNSMPIYDWTDEMVEEFIKEYDIELSKAYTVYGCNRTGCSACPFAKDVKQELKILYDYEPKMYKAMMFWLKDVYMYQLVECDWDEEYMKEYREFLLVIEARRKEMAEKFRTPNQEYPQPPQKTRKEI